MSLLTECLKTLSKLKVIMMEDNTIKRKVKETIEINRRYPSLKKDKGLELLKIYSTILPWEDLAELVS